MQPGGIDRDLSLVEFERRVLEEAKDPRNPLLERVRFLGFLGQNLDEFVMTRGRKWLASSLSRPVARKIHALLYDGHRVLQRDLVPALASAGIHLLQYDSLTVDERADVDDRFVETVLPLITPLSCEETFAGMPALGLNFAVLVDDVRPRLTIARVPDQVSSLIAVNRKAESFIWLDQVMAANLHRLVHGARVVSAYRFRILRDADIALEPGDHDGLPGRTIEAVCQRDTNPVLMMAIERAAPGPVVDRLAQALSVQPDAILRPRQVVDLKRLWDFSIVHRADLRYPPLMPQTPLRVAEDMFATLQRGDVLLHHPFESFRPVIDLLQQAAADPAVEAISATLYRTDRGDSPLVESLLDAARRGKQVRVIVELKARFDERRNAEWSRALKAAGAHVIHAPAGLKVHAKMLLIARREGRHLRRYAHLSSGNYSTFTSTVYTDIGLLTWDETITADIAEIFDFMTGEIQAPVLRSVLAAPFALRSSLKALVEREIAWAQRGEAAHIVLKMNALIDAASIDLLCRASEAGVQVDLIVRGVSVLRPGIPRVSERIRVRSIVGRFLEHSRLWYFRNGGSEEAFIGSADLMPRNFDRRIEVVVPIKDRALAHRVRYEILGAYLSDTVSARELLANGRYRRVGPRAGEPPVSSQSLLLELASPDPVRQSNSFSFQQLAETI